MLTEEQREQLERQVRVDRASDDNVPITLAEEAEFNRSLAEFLTRADSSARCQTKPGVVCHNPRLVATTRRIEGSSFVLRNVELVVQRYRCLSCGAVAVSAVSREKPKPPADPSQNSEPPGVA